MRFGAVQHELRAIASCLISCSHFSPLGGAWTSVGSMGGTKLGLIGGIPVLAANGQLIGGIVAVGCCEERGFPSMHQPIAAPEFGGSLLPDFVCHAEGVTVARCGKVMPSFEAVRQETKTIA
jgi:hypothetical protein